MIKALEVTLIIFISVILLFDAFPRSVRSRSSLTLSESKKIYGIGARIGARVKLPSRPIVVDTIVVSPLSIEENKSPISCEEQGKATEIGDEKVEGNFEVPVIPLETVLLEQVESQILVSNDRQLKMKALQAQLSKSMARKNEVDQIITKEIIMLKVPTIYI